MPETYEERYCAFVDILGFTELVGAVERGALGFSEVRDLLSIVRSIEEDRGFAPRIGFHAANLRYQSISDAICLSAANRAAGLVHLFWSLQYFGMSLLRKGYFARGAVVKGRMYHDDKMAFGDALVRAFNLEHTIARYPRIMLTREVALDVEKYAAEDAMAEHLGNTVSKGDDGPHYFHLLRALMILQLETIDQDMRRTLVRRFNKLADLIQLRFEEAADNPSHFEKVRWFADYWNDSISTLPELNRIYGVGLRPPSLPSHPILHT